MAAGAPLPTPAPCRCWRWWLACGGAQVVGPPLRRPLGHPELDGHPPRVHTRRDRRPTRRRHLGPRASDRPTHHGPAGSARTTAGSGPGSGGVPARSARPRSRTGSPSSAHARHCGPDRAAGAHRLRRRHLRLEAPARPPRSGRTTPGPPPGTRPGAGSPAAAPRPPHQHRRSVLITSTSLVVEIWWVGRPDPWGRRVLSPPP